MTKRTLRLISMIMSIALVAAACTSNDSGDETTTTPADSETTTTGAPVETTTAPVETTATPATEETSTTTAGEAMEVVCDEPVKVGVITDQTGPLAIYGTHVMRGFPLGLEYATGAPGTDDAYPLDDCLIEVIYKDDASDPETSAAVARDLIEVDGVDIIVGSVSSDVTTGIQELALDSGVIHIAAPAAANDLTGATFNPNSFRTSRNNYQDAVNMCQYLPDEYATYVQIAPDDSFGHGGATALRDSCTFFGGQFVAGDILAPPDTTDFTTYMDQVLESEAEALLVTWAGGGFVPLLQSAQDRGVLDEMALAAGFVDNQVMPVFFSEAIGTTSGILYHYTLPDNPINDWLVEHTQKEFGTPPDLFDADAFNAALLVTEALKATGGDAGEDALRVAMEGITFEGPKGTIEIRAEDHVALQDMYIVTLTNLDDPESKFFELVTTNRPPVPCLLEGELAERCGDLPVGTLSG